MGGSWSKAGVDTSLPTQELPQTLCHAWNTECLGSYQLVYLGTRITAEEGQEVALDTRKKHGLLFFWHLWQVVGLDKVWGEKQIQQSSASSCWCLV